MITFHSVFDNIYEYIDKCIFVTSLYNLDISEKPTIKSSFKISQIIYFPSFIRLDLWKKKTFFSLLLETNIFFCLILDILAGSPPHSLILCYMAEVKSLNNLDYLFSTGKESQYCLDFAEYIVYV